MLCGPQIVSPLPRKLSFPAIVVQALCGLFLTMEAALQRAVSLKSDTENDTTGKGQTHSFIPRMILSTLCARPVAGRDGDVQTSQVWVLPSWIPQSGG